MALWGTADAVYATGTITVDLANETITGSGTTFTNAAVGDVISIGVGNTYGEAIISGITSDTFIAIGSTQFIRVNAGHAIAGVAYTISQKPKYTLHDSIYRAPEAKTSGFSTSLFTNAVFGVDVYETGAATTTKYGVAHAGWVGVTSYMDMHGNLRVKSEVLVAMSGISTGVSAAATDGDADDDVSFKDFLISITTQPVSRVGIASTAATTFSVTATSTPITDLSYQWQYASSVGAAYTNLSDSGIYSNTTTATVGIASTTVNVPDGYYYRVQVSATSAETVQSDAALLDYA
jgi:hypothetical protein